MEKYKNLNGDSGVESYEIGATYIIVKFSGTSYMYEYTYKSAGMENVETMKKLAKQGNGLNSFIIKNVRNRYSRKQL